MKKHPVFRLKPINRQNKAIIKCVGEINENEKLGDELVELSKPIHPQYAIFGKHAIPIKSIGKYDMTGLIYRCNIIDTHVVITKRYPLMCLNVMYERSIVSGCVFQIFVSIEMPREEKQKIRKNNDYINLEFSGLWFRQIECDKELTDNYDKYLVEMLENEGTNKFFETQNKDDYKNDESILEWINNYVFEERKYYDDIMNKNGIVINFTTLDNLRDDLVELCMSDKFYKLIEIGMKCREKQRLKERNIDEEMMEYKIPEKITKLDDIKNKLLADDEIDFE